MSDFFAKRTGLGWMGKLGCLMLLVAGCASGALPARALPELRVDGRHLVDPDGQPVVLQGVNLGNWFLLESWMLELDTQAVPDHHTFVTTLTERFGPEEAARLMEVHYAHWFTADDFDRLTTFGFNAVRLPFHYTLVERDRGTSPYDFRWLDHAIQLARDAGLYVILDLHGAPGGQSVDQPSGRVGENNLWTSEEAQQRMVNLWIALAERYGNEPVVAAYDVLNEPYGNMSQDLRQPMVDLMNRVVPAIRNLDPHTLIYAPGTLQGIAFYGDPADHGWTNTGFTEHYYRGLYGDVTALSSHLDLLGPTAAAKQRFFLNTNAPMLVGEFNVVFDHVGGPHLMRAYYDRFEELGWSATMWCAKRLLKSPDRNGDGWALMTNATPIEPIDIFTDSLETLENKLISYGRGGVITNERMRSALSAKEPAAVFPIDRDAAITEPTRDALPAPWQAADLGDATAGGQRVDAEHWIVTGGGSDIFGFADAFRFVSRELPEGKAWTAWTALESFAAADRYAKAGWMVRDTADADAAHILLHVFPDGTLMLAQRDTQGGDSHETKLGVTCFPVGLAVQRDGETLRFAATNTNGHWNVLAERRPDWLNDDARLGLATLAHDRLRTADATYRAPRMSQDALTDLPGVSDASTDPSASDRLALSNDSFEQRDGWHTWGGAIGITEDGEAFDGKQVMRYTASGAGDEAGAWQDVRKGVAFGHTLNATTWVRADRAAGDAGVELRLESPPLRPGGPWITLGTATLDAASSVKAGGWLPIRVRGTAMADTVRLLVRVNGAADVSLDAVSVSAKP